MWRCVSVLHSWDLPYRFCLSFQGRHWPVFHPVLYEGAAFGRIPLAVFVTPVNLWLSTFLYLLAFCHLLLRPIFILPCKKTHWLACDRQACEPRQRRPRPSTRPFKVNLDRIVPYVRYTAARLPWHHIRATIHHWDLLQWCIEALHDIKWLTAAWYVTVSHLWVFGVLILKNSLRYNS